MKKSPPEIYVGLCLLCLHTLASCSALVLLFLLFLLLLLLPHLFLLFSVISTLLLLFLLLAIFPFLLQLLLFHLIICLLSSSASTHPHPSLPLDFTPSADLHFPIFSRQHHKQNIKRRMIDEPWSRRPHPTANFSTC